MMRRTHFAIGVFFVFFFLSIVTHKISFFIVTLLATLIPDIDSAYSGVGRFSGLRLFQFFVKHRGLIHSFTFCIFISVILALILPILAFPFFLGYSLHLIFDTLTIEGTTPFWPSKKRASWIIRTNSNTEKAIFLTFILLTILVVIFKYL